MDTQKHIVNVTENCFRYVRVFSEGLWNVESGRSILQHSLVRLHVQLLSMFFLAGVFHFFLKRLHFSRFTSDILAGIVLGPTVLGSKAKFLFPTITPNQVMSSLSKIGYMFFVFFAGVQMDTTLVWKTGKKASCLAILMYVTNFTMLRCTEFYFHKDNELPDRIKFTIKNFRSIYFESMTLTEFVGVSHLLMQLKIINSQLGRLALAASMQNKMISLAFGIADGVRRAIHIMPRVGIQMIILSLAFLLFIVIILRQLIFTFIRRTPEGQPLKEIYATITAALVFLLASSADNVGLHYTFGPLIFGLIVPARSPLAEILVARFNTAVSGFLLPLMTVFCASTIDLNSFVSKFGSLLTFKISLIGFAIKVAVTFVGVFLCKLPLRHAVALTVILNAKGLYEVGFFLNFTPLKEIQDTSGILLLFLLQAFQPLLVKILYHPSEHYISYKEKNIEQASDDSELHILVCAHRQEDAIAAIMLLEYSNPTKQSPLSIYGLCLQELVNNFIPALINHQLGQKKASSSEGGSRSQPIIDIFKYFQSRYDKLVQMHVFTTISPFRQMHEDICWLSFDKACSLILIPFHKKWNRKGKMVSSNTYLRDLNISVLENAPCSVGILVDRKRTQGLSSIFVTSTTYRVAALFVGGPDDKEALAYALRMARCPRVHLTIMRVIAHHDHVHHNWYHMENDSHLRSVKTEISGCKNVNYVEETVRDGSQTSAIIKSMAGDYDLIMVGRQHETKAIALSGLSEEWIDFPELGPMGDLLASEDICHPVSVLVIQQKKQEEIFSTHS